VQSQTIVTTAIKERFLNIRKHTEYICSTLQPEDVTAQPADFVSPPKWHLAHTTWFFEQFVLSVYQPNYKAFHKDYAYYFNSYYNTVGTRVIRSNRGTMTRPTLQEVLQYRTYVNKHMAIYLEKTPEKTILDVIEIGLQHEQQHQELLIYDIKYIFGQQPVLPQLNIGLSLYPEIEDGYITIDEDVYNIGFNIKDAFCWDNELGYHKVYSHEFKIAKCLVTNADYIDFIDSGAYDDFNLWHADGWDYIQKNDIIAPQYWYKIDNIWKHYTLNGFVDVNPKLPVSHISFYEAWAFAEWKGMRLPTEFEWEIAAEQLQYGQLWEWTNSAYLPYPNFKKPDGALGEYNGKFMVNQMVLRGGSIASPADHIRPTYRNFFQPEMRWLFSGIRLAQ